MSNWQAWHVDLNCSHGAIDKGPYKVMDLPPPDGDIFIAGICPPAAALKGYPFFSQHVPSLGGMLSERNNTPIAL